MVGLLLEGIVNCRVTRGVNGWLVIKTFTFGGNYFARGEFVLCINHSGKYI